MTTPSLLTSLLTLITTATQDLQSELAAEGLPEPWIDTPALHPWEEGTPSWKYWEARRTLLSALGMMTAVVQSPREKHFIDGLSYQKPAAFNFIAETRIADILATPDVDERVGLPVAAIAQRAGTHPAKTERVLRALCTAHYFQETAPAVFANNKLSHLFKAGQSVALLPLFWGDIGLRASGGLSPTLRSPMTAHSLLATDASFAHVYAHGHPAKVLGEREHAEPHVSGVVVGERERAEPHVSGVVVGERERAEPHVSGVVVGERERAEPRVSGVVVGSEDDAVKEAHGRVTVFDFLACPENSVPRAAFAAGMITLETMYGTQGSLDFPWGRWDEEGAVFVDVGASTGHLSLSVLPALTHARFVNQDRPETCAQGAQLLAEKWPAALHSGRVAFQPHDFFAPQPVKGAALYILSNILHIWADAPSRTILAHLVDAMAPASRVLVIEIAYEPALAHPPRGAAAAPWPLLANYGLASEFAHAQSLELINIVNGVSRTLAENVALFERAGLQLVRVHPLRRHVSVMELSKRA